MTNPDAEAMNRLLTFLHAAIDEQYAHVQDQLRAALRDGRTSLRFEPSAVSTVAVVSVDGYDLAEVDIRHLVDA